MKRQYPTMATTPRSRRSSSSNQQSLTPITSIHGLLRLSGLLLIALVAMSTLMSSIAGAQENPAPTELVVVIPISGPIEPGIGHFLQRSLDDAEANGAVAVILDINTPGGRLDTVLEMRDALLDTPLRTIAFVNREAFSAGALITIASSEIWVAPGGVFGAATPILGTETADAKTIAAVRSTFRSTAETRGLDPAVAEAMVDPEVEVPGLDSATTLLSLSSDQAIQYGYADGVAKDRIDLLGQLGLSGATVEVSRISFIEQVVRWVTDPVVASLLILAGLFLIVADALFAGFGVAAVAGLACFGLFFWGHLLANLAGWEDFLLIAIGLALIGVEVFVIPGFGFAGIAGTIALAGGLFLAMTGRGFWDFNDSDNAIRAGWSIATGLVGSIVAIFLVGWLLSRSGNRQSRPLRGIGRLTLQTTVASDRLASDSARRPGWLVRTLGGSSALETGGETMPDTDQHKKYS